MYFLKRFHFDNIGHNEAWFQNFTIDLSSHSPDADSDDIGYESLINLSNTGGKSSMISFLFNAFVTHKNDFIQSKQTQKAHKFEDYFTSVPGLIAIELEKPIGNLFDDYSCHVIGQYIRVPKKNGSQAERVFFHFVADKKLSFDIVPSKSRNNLTKWEDVQRGLREMKQANVSFFSTGNQKDYRKHLEDAGIDIWLIKKQMQFCSKEGGGALRDDFAFSSERKFLSSIFAMTMNPEAVKANRDELGGLVKKNEARPTQKATKKVLELFRYALIPFNQKAGHFTSCKQAVDAEKKNCAQLLCQLEEALLFQTKSIATLDEKKATTNTEKERLVGIYNTHAATCEALSSLKALRGIEQAKEHETHLERGSDDIKVELLEIRAYRQVFEELQQTKQTVETLDVDLQQASSDITVPKENMEKAKAQCFNRLVVLTEELTGKITNATLERKEHRDRIKIENKKLIELDGTEKKLSKHNIEIGYELSEIKAALKLLNQQNIILLSEEPSAAKGYLKEFVKELTSTDESFAAEQGEVEGQHSKAVSAEDQTTSEITELEKEYTEVSREFRIAKAKEAALQKERVLRQIMGNNEFNPDTEHLSIKLREELSAQKENAHNIAGKIKEATGELKKLTETGSLLADSATELVLKDLLDRNFQSAALYPKYLADVLKDNTTEIQKVIESNPAKFLGIKLQDDDFTRLKNSAEKISGLTRPVIVSTPTIEPDLDNVENNAVVLSPADKTVYSEKALNLKIEELESNVSRYTDELTTCDVTREEIGALLVKLTSFRKDFGNGRIDDLEASKESLKTQLEEGGQKLQQIGGEIEGHKAHTGKIKRSKRNIVSLRSEAKRVLKERIIPYLVAAHKTPGLLEAREKNLEALTQNATDKTTANNEIINKGKLIDKAKERLIRLKHDLELYEQRTPQFKTNIVLDGGLDHNDNHLSLDDLEQRFLNLEELYTTLVEEKGLAVLQTKLEVAQKRLEELEGVYITDFKEVPQEALEKYMGRSKKEMASFESRKRKEFDEGLIEIGACRREIITLKHNHEEFEEGREYKDTIIDDLGQSIPEINELLASQESAKTNTETKVHDLEEETEKDVNEYARLCETEKDIKTEIKEFSSLPLQDVAAEYEEQWLLTKVNFNSDEWYKYRLKLQQTLEDVKVVEDAIDKLFLNIKDVVFTEQFQTYEPKIAKDFQLYTHTSLSIQCKALVEQVDSLIHALNDELQASEGEINRCTSAVYQQATIAIGILKDMTKVKIPESIKLVGGNNIMRVSFDFSRVSEQRQKEQIRHYIEEVMDSGNIPFVDSDADEFTASVILKIAEGFNHSSINVGILKLATNISSRPIYYSLSQLKGSSGQRLVAILLLYLILVGLRGSSTRASKGHNKYSGFLIMDNPIGEANLPNLIRPQIKLAREIGIQLIYFTGILDYNSLSEFQNYINIRKTGIDYSKERVHLGVDQAQTKIENVKWDFGGSVNAEETTQSNPS